MKKIFFSALMMASVFGFQSCSDEEIVNPEPALGVATISGTLYADIDETNDKVETAPANTTIIAKVNSKELALVPDEDAIYGDIFYQTTTDENGKYSFKINVASKDATVLIYPQDVVLSVKKYDADGEIIQENEIFSTSEPTSVQVYQGGMFIRNLSYNGNSIELR